MHLFPPELYCIARYTLFKTSTCERRIVLFFVFFFHYLLLQNLMKYLFVGLSRQLLLLCTHLHTYIHTYISTYICFLVPHEFVVLFPSVSGFALLRTYSTYNRNENVLYKQPNIQLYSLLFNTRKKRNGKSWAHWV